MMGIIWYNDDDLIGGLEHDFYDFPYIGNFITPTDELIFFQRGRYTTNQIMLGNYGGNFVELPET